MIGSTIAFYLGIGAGLCLSLSLESRPPGHWTNYPMMIFGWPFILIHVWHTQRKQ